MSSSFGLSERLALHPSDSLFRRPRQQGVPAGAGLRQRRGQPPGEADDCEHDRRHPVWFIYLQRAEEGPQSPARTLALRSGSCRDFATLMIDALQRRDIAARFVSGCAHSTGINSAIATSAKLLPPCLTQMWLRNFSWPLGSDLSGPALGVPTSHQGDFHAEQHPSVDGLHHPRHRR